MQILLIDSYDSFTYNLVSLLEKISHVHVTVIHNNSISADELDQLRSCFDAIVVGPGPGSPALASDVGIIPQLWTSNTPIPVLGVCLGFQSLLIAYGYSIHQMKSVRHGIISKINHSNVDLFNDIPTAFKAVRYHSLFVKQDVSSSPITPSAWADDGQDNGGQILMAAQHNDLPFYGVQYHPESVCSEYGSQLMLNFVKLAQQWVYRNPEFQQRRANAMMTQSLRQKVDAISSPPPLSKVLYPNHSVTLQYKTVREGVHDVLEKAFQVADFMVTKGTDITFLDSASDPGTHSIIGIRDSYSSLLSYRLGDSSILVEDFNNEKHHIPVVVEDDRGFWNALSLYISSFGHLSDVCDNLKFVGGLQGYISYALGAQSGLDVHLTSHARLGGSDAELAFIRRSICFDKPSQKIYAVSIVPNDHEWLDSTEAFLNDAFQCPIKPIPSLPQIQAIVGPKKEDYMKRVEQAQEFLATGDSYELCLTAQTKITLASGIDPWSLYKRLRSKNPAPYAAFFKFNSGTVISSSPERFLSCSSSGLGELRPIKGTVKKSQFSNYADVEKILHSEKEMAENLMIVDLIRHDLSLLSSDVNVSGLMKIEEYKTVYQLVTAIQGHINKPYIGIDALAHSLPPGSMTGAPKKRSIEILDRLETSQRGIYSGVFGYWSLNGQLDWSVAIRSAFCYDQGWKQWYVGAGGAITALSRPEDEWDEMEVKLSSAFRAFENN